MSIETLELPATVVTDVIVQGWGVADTIDRVRIVFTEHARPRLAVDLSVGSAAAIFDTLREHLGRIVLQEVFGHFEEPLA